MMNKYRKLQQRGKLLMMSRGKIFWDTAKYGTYERGVNDHARLGLKTK